MEIVATNLSKEYGSQAVFDGLTFTIASGEKVGLVGYNGVGKSTLLKILAGQEEVDGGSVKIPKGVTLAYVPQDLRVDKDESLLEYIESVAHKAKGAAHKIERHKIESMLDAFGIGEIDLKTKMSKLSSGQKTKVCLAAALLVEPGFLLLDEPTNNLDLTALIWLENYLKKTKTACVIVSHDRRFLDAIVNTIFEIDWSSKKLNISHGRYSEYLKMKEKERERLTLEYEKQEQEQRRVKKLIKRSIEHAERGAKYTPKDNDKYSKGFFRDRAGKTGKKIQAYKSRLEQMDKTEKPAERRRLTIDIDNSRGGGSKLIQLSELVVGYKDGFQLEPLSLDIKFGDRVLLLGDNGAGKSTLLKTILGKIEPLSGDLKIGTAVRVADFTQEHENLPADKTLLDFLQEKGVLQIHEAYNLARKYGFDELELKKRLGSFSPGARARILFALFSVLDVNALVLDEPSNHLDMEALEALEEVIKNYKGTIILVSHDRHLLDIVQPTIVLLVSGNGKIEKRFDFDEYIEQAKKRAERLGYLI